VSEQPGIVHDDDGVILIDWAALLADQGVPDTPELRAWLRAELTKVCDRAGVRWVEAP
jgi:hypothetical protein